MRNRRNVDSAFRDSADVPLISMTGKPNGEGRPDSRMIEFAQVSPLQLAVNVVAVGAVAAVQIVLNAER